MNKNKLTPPPELVLTACLSAGLTIVLTLISIVLCTLALIYRYECGAGDLETSNGAQYFIATLIRVYILHDECSSSLSVDSLTKADSIFILAIIILVFAVFNFITAVMLISVVRRENAARSLDITTYLYVGVSLACLVVDLTLGVHFGMDYESLKNTLALNSAGLAMNYQNDTIRLGAFMLLAVSLKGFIAHAINIVLLILLTYLVVAFQKRIQEDEHSIHKLGVLNAFDHPKRLDEPWSAQRHDRYIDYPRGNSMHHPDDDHMHTPMRDNTLPIENSSQPRRLEDPWQSNRKDMYMGPPRGPHVNPAYNHDEEHLRSHLRDNPLSDMNRNSTKRPDSWLHNQMNSGPGLGSRPFSYLEEPKRPIPVKPPTTPATEPQWRRDAWPPAPPVPDPDYSPPPRRLKSALKSNYP